MLEKIEYFFVNLWMKLGIRKCDLCNGKVSADHMYIRILNPYTNKKELDMLLCDECVLDVTNECGSVENFVGEFIQSLVDSYDMEEGGEVK